jgi:hypothetical protein
MWEIFSEGRAPYIGMTNREVKFPRNLHRCRFSPCQVADSTLEEGCTLKKPATMPDQLWSLACLCWQKRQQDRPTFANLFEELRVITGYDLEALDTFGREKKLLARGSSIYDDYN